MSDSNWIESRINQLETASLQKIFECRTPEAVEAAVTYARFLASLGVTPENCPAFLRLLEVENRWVSEALVGDQDPFRMLSVVQPSRALIEHIFRTLNRWPRGSARRRFRRAASAARAPPARRRCQSGSRSTDCRV